MLWLPELMESGLSLPLSLGAAPALAAALAGGASEPVMAALGEAMSGPSLAVWTVHRAWSLERIEIRTVGAAAEWLARHAAAALDWGDGESTQAGDERLAGEYLRLTTASARVAMLARDCALSGEFAPEAERLYLLGLLHATDEWWGLAAKRGGSTDAVPHGVPQPPPWLAEALGHLQRPSSSAPGALALVAGALRPASDQNALESRDFLEAHRPAAKGPAALAASLPSLAALARGRSPGDNDQLETAKLEAMAEFAAGAGHEINNPLAVIAGRAQLLLDGESNPQRRRELAVIHGQAMRVYEMIADMMLFARPPKPKLAPCDVRQVLQEVIAEIRPKASERKVDLSVELPAEVESVEADATQLAAAVRAVCDNALSAVDRGGRIRVRMERPADGSPEPRSVTIVIADNGSGISDEVRPHIFDPFYSGRQAGRGLGMGLAKAWRIVRGHQGRIEVDSQPGLGSTFRIILPGVREIG